jgi:hypothetical protein
MNAWTLGAELLHRSLWYPTLQGVLVVAAAIGLFCGSIYLLLGTNLGARLGFLVAFTGLMGFMVILTALWMTTSSPLNTLKGRIPAWQVEQVVDSLDQAKIADARSIEKTGKKANTIEAANVKAAVDERLVEKQSTAVEKLKPDANKFARFQQVTDYLTTNTYEAGGSKPNPLKFQFTHTPQIAAVQFCLVAPSNAPFGVPPPKPACDPTKKTGFVILKRDLGQLRLPPFLAFVAFGLLFLLGLLLLHWRERDEAEVAAQKTGPAPAPVPART